MGVLSYIGQWSEEQQEYRMVYPREAAVFPWKPTPPVLKIRASHVSFEWGNGMTLTS